MRDKEEERVDSSRRTWLIATSVVGGIGGVAAVVPFASSLEPSEKAKAAGAPVEVDIGDLKPGEMKTVAWRGKPVWVINRSDDMLKDVTKADNEVADPHTENPFTMPDPSYCKNEYRSRTDHKNILVVVAVCSHLGCSPTARFTPGPQPSLPNDWPGGFLCPCHGSTYDLAGRVFKNKPAPQNLDVPRYMFTSATTIVIGKDEQGEA
ncbi:ubiquinol-cytochrome c reductase iron-sulfur subunit [Trinickia caryophylli]|uniref:Ubiquinol-cytochrome c reductase iron-sulfur subunit n=1 Tax=Trinickia caryophylli TaxID=28094 RepID=A0A1X7F4H3_TRICW|nr:ubiquinol-cytochrome c reductase iron-sulfur subunit [Trinickia caryophylli]PMS10406.1 ubiquinol-cytochrome c reductase iron-sulfur subunit [Trinickia caryophylli]TRX19476.1 ubiquinol-cytochrome c reductase iron-sulfur subunit [Trinickia caryophylli]WQE13219.1 ubiquinol-cytochrome c reductase iron-sulfur subunit [Trinickia caryophylli]SMF45104.1 ubiquinol-cytochrome c reductase iron-sulfur subunit [Trinickia caryophylli]GLU34468.1 ubiquinol-cytochrome c reductase iron-sulfur subunit [Trinic